MKMNEIEITLKGGSICFQQQNPGAESGYDRVYITLDQSEIIASEILKLTRQGKK